ncbi:hypothetical protein JD82_03044 [Prauserella rugosa]|uniref:TadE-like protein n=1 Tax=Prauserella rugosa TaxID=43354 RepID=A0A660CHZ6_9PSEU|nr:hypothetical protein JD82_03044 [Prauserella rugosa]
MCPHRITTRAPVRPHGLAVGSPPGDRAARDGPSDHRFPTGSAASRGLSGDRGAVTVEGAITVCSLVVVVGLLLSTVAAMLDQLRCADAAGEAARLLGRGDEARAHESVGRLAPDGAVLTVDEDGTGISVTVRAAALGGLLPGIDVSADAYAVREPGSESEVSNGDDA